MVAARAGFLDAGHYRPLAEAVGRLAAESAPEPGLAVETGSGTAYYLARALDRLPSAVGCAADVSKFAAKRAARAHPRLGAVVADAWERLPLATGSAGLLLSVFSPRNPREMRRILRGDGAMIVVTPQRRHLHELRSAAGLLEVGADKESKISRALEGLFRRAASHSLCWRLTLQRAEAEALVQMGPSAWHIDPAEIARRVASLDDPVSVTAAATVQLYRPC